MLTIHCCWGNCLSFSAEIIKKDVSAQFIWSANFNKSNIFLVYLQQCVICNTQLGNNSDVRIAKLKQVSLTIAFQINWYFGYVVAHQPSNPNNWWLTDSLLFLPSSPLSLCLFPKININARWHAWEVVPSLCFRRNSQHTELTYREP